jgi:hypothetical protein
MSYVHKLVTPPGIVAYVRVRNHTFTMPLKQEGTIAPGYNDIGLYYTLSRASDIL